MVKNVTETVVSGLHQALAQLAGEQLGVVERSDLEAQVVGLRRCLDRLEYQWLRRVAACDRVRRADASVRTSIVTWLALVCGLSFGVARAKVALARRLDAMPATALAAAHGEISPTKAQVLSRAQQAHPAAFAEHEAMLVEQARGLSVRNLRKAVEYWRQNLDYQAALDDANALHERRNLHVSPTLGGMARVDGWLDPELTGVVSAALAAVTDATNRAKDDYRTPSQRRADALGTICRFFLDHGQAPVTGGERPHLSVIVDLAALQRGVGRCEARHGEVIVPELARRLACDAGVSRVIVGPDSVPLDVGRRVRVVTTAQRRALDVRDGGCRWVGCDMPPRWCDAHHVIAWVDGGATDLANLVLLCRRHHRLVHEGGANLTLKERSPPVAA